VLTHIVLVRLTEDAGEEQVAALVAGLRGLPDQIPHIRSYTVARDLGLAEGNYDLVVTGRFASPEDLRAYIAHPAHQQVVHDLLDPISADRVRIQYASQERDG
jgi:hypothetical protein